MIDNFTSHFDSCQPILMLIAQATRLKILCRKKHLNYSNILKQINFKIG